jgi:hypothetical protein
MVFPSRATRKPFICAIVCAAGKVYAHFAHSSITFARFTQNGVDEEIALALIMPGSRQSAPLLNY